jgi:hypothetical protein
LPPPEGKKAEDMLKVRERIVEPVRELLRRERELRGLRKEQAGWGGLE